MGVNPIIYQAMAISNPRPISVSNRQTRPLIINIDRLPEKIELKTTRIRQSLERVKRNGIEIEIGGDGSSSSRYSDGKRNHYIF